MALEELYPRHDATDLAAPFHIEGFVDVTELHANNYVEDTPEAMDLGVTEVDDRVRAIGLARDEIATAYETDTTHGVDFFSTDADDKPGFDTTGREVFSGRLSTRSARQGEGPALAAIELRAFRDVYGEQVTPEKVAAVEQTFEERIELLGDWIKVMDDERGKVAGMMICCPFSSSESPEAIADSNMTSNETLAEVFEPEGDKVYIVNLAVDPDAPKNVRYMLFGRMLSEAVTRGVTEAYLESRLPGLKAWCADEKGIDPAMADEKTMTALAEEYWQSTRVNSKGKEVPRDPLLRIYTNSGVRPIKLVQEAWSKDNPSAGYGVFGVREVPVPGPVLRNRFARKVVGRAIRTVSDSNFLMKKVFDGRR